MGAPKPGVNAQVRLARKQVLPIVPGKSVNGPVLDHREPTSQSKRTAPAARSQRGAEHPGVLEARNSFLAWRLGSDEPIRLPDQYSKPTAACVLKSEYTVSSDANGYCVFGEGYNLTGSALSATVTAGSLGAVSTAAHPQLSAFTAEAKAARMVAMVINVTYVGRADDCAGTLTYDEKTETAFGATTVAANEVSGGLQVRADKGMTIYGSYTQEPRWESPTVSSFMNNTFLVHSFFGSGLTPSKVTFRVRVHRFLEYLPADGSISEGSTTVETYDPIALAVNSVLAVPAASVDVGGADVGKARRLLNAAYNIVQPVGRWAVNEAKQVIAAEARRLAQTAAGPLLLAAASAA